MRTTAKVVVIVALAGVVGPRAAAADPKGKKVTVMTRNLYAGGDLGPATAAVLSGNVSAILTEVGALWESVRATNFPARAEALALEVRDAKPDLIGLQEASLWRTGPAFSPAQATTVAYDY